MTSLPTGWEHLLGRARWDADAVRDDLRDYVVDALGDPEAVLVVDETGDLKKGAASVGVQRQYTGTAGRIENAQVAVYLTYATTRGHALINRALYLPTSWAGDPERRAQATIPTDIGFATKPAQARRGPMASIQRRPDGQWRARYRGPDGRERSKHFTRKRHAERWLAGVTTSVVRGEWADPALSTVSLSEWASRWLQGQTHLKPSIRARYEGLLTKHVVPAFGTTCLAGVRTADVQTWVSGLTESGLAAASVRQAHRVLHLVLDLGRVSQGSAVTCGTVVACREIRCWTRTSGR